MQCSSLPHRLYVKCLGAEVARVKAHSHFIQGVSWDPLGTFIASLGADRTLKLFKVPAAAAASMRDASQSESASDGASSALKKGKLTLTSVSVCLALCRFFCCMDDIGAMAFFTDHQGCNN